MTRALRRRMLVPALMIALAGLSGCAISLQSLPKIQGVNGPTYQVYAVFGNVLNLPDNAEVRLGAQVVGQVGSIETKDFAADLTLDVERSVRLPQGTTAQIRFDNPLGDEYVLLTPPAGPTLGASGLITAGSHIPQSRTSTAPSVEDTFGALSLVLNGGGINQLQTIIHELNNTFNGNQPQIRSFLSTIDRAASSVAGGRNAVDGALVAIEHLSQALGNGRTTIANGIDSIAPAVGVLAGENSQISSLLTELSNLGAVGTQVAEQSGQDSVNDAHDLLPVVQQLQAVDAQLAPDLADLSFFEAQSQKLAPGDYLQVNAVANVLLPSGAFEPTIVPATATPTSPLHGDQAVTGLLEGGLL